MGQKRIHRTLAVLCAIPLYCCTNVAVAQAPAMQASVIATPPATQDFGAGVFLNNTSFDIPFSVERTGAQPVEVQLFVSRDQGKTWKFFARQPANESGFPFQAPEDGDFWFSTRTIDARGISYPTGNMAPQLRVFVDTTNPQVQATTDSDINGQIVLDYAITDVAVDEEYMQLEYMTDAVRQWMPISIEGRPGRRPEDGALVGRITWQPQTEWRQVYVRMIVRDKAGNQTVFNEQVQRPRVASNPMTFASGQRPPGPGMAATAVSDRSTFRGSPTYAQPATTPGYTQPAYRSAQAAPVANPAYPPATAPAPSTGQPVAATNSAYNYTHPTTSQYRGAVPMTARAVSDTQGFGLNPPLQQQQQQQPVGGQTPNYAATEPAASSYSPPSTPQQNQSMQRPAAPREAFRPLQGTQVSASTPAEAQSPAEASGERQARSLSLNDTPRVTRSKQFSLDYEVESVGNGGVEAVELWGTRDGGQTWQRWNADPDKQSPFDIEVSKEGIVGFRIVIVAANGLTTPRPVSGDPADIYVLVDTTAPQTRVTGATYGDESYTGSLIIDYACNDENFGPRPISLAFSDSLDGPWTTIATGLANTGRYIWPADPQLPREIYLRVEATDKAGNVGVHALDVPISVQGLSPQGRINGFQPIEGQPEGTQAALPRASFR
ncbi:hypothetical protein [Rosistilla oblonga]|nr:hypothetical protein [Rosistilla oblonga]